ncbi:MAG: sulfotransferase domain-containing protein, partial [Actinomycetota bacterium]
MMTDPACPATRRYRGFIADTARWERFVFRPDDVVISTPAKCGTTWMQTIVGMLLLDRVDLGAPIATISPWLDMLTRTDDEVFGLLDAQTHRRFIKTHAPLDGIPRHDPVTYITVVRHPLDVALSDRDHNENQREDRLVELRLAASGEPDPDLPVGEDRPEDTGDYLRWFIDNHEPPVGSGPHGLEDYCQQVRTYWDAREVPNVHLFHYADMWADLDGEMRRVAAA